MRTTAFLLLGALALGAGTPAARAQTQTLNFSIVGVPVPTVGVPFEVRLDFITVVPPEAARILLRPTGSTEPYTPVEAAQDPLDFNRFALTIPGALLEPAGVDFYFEYVDDGETLTSPELSPELNPFRLPTVSRRIEAPITLLPRQYQMVTVPARFLSSGVAGALTAAAAAYVPGFVLSASSPDSRDVLGDETGFGPYDEERWRVLRWDPLAGALGAGAYLDGPLEAGAFAPGKGMWLASASGGGFDVESVYPAGFEVTELQPASLPIEVLLQPGWNQMGNPYLFPIAWEDVEGSALVREPVASVGEVYEGLQDVLEPWVGYFVFNPNPNAVPLLFSIPQEAALPQRTLAARLLDKAGSEGFLLQIQTDEVMVAAAGAARRARSTFAGVGREALQLKTPPPVNGGLQVRLRDEEGQPLASAITADASGATWTLDFIADDAWTRSRLFEVRVDEHGRRPAGWAYRLTDAATGEPVPLEGAAFRIALGPDRATRSFRLTLGPDAALGTEPLAPTGPLFGRVGPNPVQSGRAVELAYRTPGGAAEIVVLDLLGRPVHRLAANPQPGWHDATWNGQADGAAVAPGVYLFHLRTPTGQAVRKLTVLR